MRLRAQSLPVPVSKPCACGHVQHHKGKRPRDIRTTLGTLSLDERHYYHCDHCNAGTYLGDELRGSTNFSPLAEDHIAWMGKEGAFEQAAKNLKHLGLLDVAASTVRDRRSRPSPSACRRRAAPASNWLRRKKEPRALPLGSTPAAICAALTENRRRRERAPCVAHWMYCLSSVIN